MRFASVDILVNVVAAGQVSSAQLQPGIAGSWARHGGHAKRQTGVASGLGAAMFRGGSVGTVVAVVDGEGTGLRQLQSEMAGSFSKPGGQAKWQTGVTLGLRSSMFRGGSVGIAVALVDGEGIGFRQLQPEMAGSFSKPGGQGRRHSTCSSHWHE